MGTSAPSMTAPSCSGGERFDDDCRALTTADARGPQPEPELTLAQGVEQVDRDAGAACGERVADGDRAAVHVGPGPIQSQLPLHGEVLRGERLVHFDEVHLL